MTPYYQDEAVTIYHGRCEDVLPHLRDVDLIFTSPPYNMGRNPDSAAPKLGHYRQDAALAARGGHGKWRAPALSAGYDGSDDALSPPAYTDWQHHVLRECWSVLSRDGAIFYNHKPRVIDGVWMSPLEYVPPEIPVRQVIIWARAGGMNYSPVFYVPTHEWIMVLAKPDFRLRSQAASGVGDVWRVPQEANPDHPAPFPLGLPARAIETTAPGLVLDPFMGSGTTLRAAKDAGVRAIGIETSERYCEIAAKRMAQQPLWGAA